MDQNKEPWGLIDYIYVNMWYKHIQPQMPDNTLLQILIDITDRAIENLSAKPPNSLQILLKEKYGSNTR